MATLQSSTSLISKTLVILESSSDWNDWLKVVEAKANNLAVWQYVNPDATTVPPQEPAPVTLSMAIDTLGDEEITRFTQLSLSQQATYKFLKEEYKEDMANYRRIINAIAEISNHIMGTISRSNFTLLTDTTPRAALITLRLRLAPSTLAQERLIAQEYIKAKQGPGKVNNIDKWMLLWETTYNEAVRLNIPDVDKRRPIFDFIEAIKPVDAIWAGSIEVYMSMAESSGSKDLMPSMASLLERYRNHRRTELLKNSTTSYNRSAFPAMFQGEPADSPASTASINNNSSKDSNGKCLCGRVHAFRKCYYLVESIRPTNWKPNSTIQETIDNKLLKNPRLQEIVRKIVQQAKQKAHKGTPDSINYSNNTTPPVLGSFATSFNVSSSKAGSASSIQYHLSDSWILDSGADIHVCNDAKSFGFIKKQDAPSSHTLHAGKNTYAIEAYGQIKITVSTSKSGSGIIILNNVALVPGFLTNIVSAALLEDKGVYVDAERKRLQQEGKTFCLYSKVGNHWLLVEGPLCHQLEQGRINAIASPNAFTTSTGQKNEPELTVNLWHQRMGHPGPETLSHLQKATIGIAKPIQEPLLSTRQCEPCALSKSHRIISRSSVNEHPSSAPFERLAFDLIQMTEGYNGDKWLTHAYCPYTKFHFTATHTTKSMVATVIQDTVAWIEGSGRAVKYLRTDGEKSLGTTFKRWVQEKGIMLEQTAPYTPEQNGAAERSGGVITAKARTMRIASLLPMDLWPEIVNCAAYLLNRTPVRSLGWKTPFEKVFSTPPSLLHIKAYGCRAYPLILPQPPRREKLALRAHIGYLIGYNSTNIFRIWIPSKQRVIKTRDVTFNEQLFYDPLALDIGALAASEPIINTMDMAAAEPLPETESHTSFLPEVTKDSNGQQLNEYPAQTTEVQDAAQFFSLPTPEATPSPSVPSTLNEPALLVDSAQSSRKSKQRDEGLLDSNILPEGTSRTRTRRQVYTALLEQSNSTGFLRAFALGLCRASSFNSDVLATRVTSASQLQGQHRDTLPPVPKYWSKLKQHPHSAGFIQAAQDEYNTLAKMGTFKYVEPSSLSTTSKPLPLLWVFSYKLDKEGYLIKYKARLCVRGDLQITFADTYAATLAARTFRALMALTAAFNLEIRQYDAVNAFVNSELDEEIFCQCPDGFEQPGKIIQLQRALYGLRQSPLLWYNHLSSTIESFGLSPVLGVSCLYTSGTILVFFHVDDIVALCLPTHIKELNEFEANLKAKYKLRIMGELGWFLGVRVVRDRAARRLWICQDSYIEKIANRFGLNNQSSYPNSPLPMDADSLLPSINRASSQQIYAYQQRIGSLNYAAVITRPDVARASSKLAEYLQNPSDEHMQLANRVISYLYGSKMLSICYDGNTTGSIFSISGDAAYADDPISRYSSFGYLFSLFGGPIDWKATKQKTVTTSTTEAELLATSATAKESIWWSRFFKAILFDVNQAITISTDNLQCYRILTRNDDRLITKLRHVDIHQLWVRQEVQKGTIKINWIPTAKMPADGLTKCLPRQKHEIFLELVGLKALKLDPGNTDKKNTPDSMEAMG